MCIVFDFDGVLVDSNAIKRSAYFEVFAFEGLTEGQITDVLDARPNANRFEVIDAILRTARPHAGESDLRSLVDEYAGRYNDLCEERVALCPEMSGATYLLTALARVAPLYLNSATPEQSLVSVVRRRGWQAFFRASLGGPRSKVDNLLKVIDCERTVPEAVTFIGDRRGDMAAAQACECRFIGFTAQGDDFADCDIPKVTDLSAIPSALNLRFGASTC